MIPPPAGAVDLATPACRRTLTDGAGDALDVHFGTGLRSRSALGAAREPDGAYFRSVLRLMLPAPDAVGVALSRRCPQVLR